MATVYSLAIKGNDDEIAQISVVEYKNFTDATLETDKLLKEKDLALLGFNYNNSMMIVPDLIIQGNKGFGLTGLNSKGGRRIQAFYWLDSKKCDCGPVSIGKTNVGVTSSYPMNITTGLMESLHVDKVVNASAHKTPLTFMPPSIK
ncbi:Uncharacterised protein [uncultured archaeon]|nr:Uncharacterised protein [uncultured archaeon]